MFFPNTLSQQVGGQDKDELTSQNLILERKKKKKDHKRDLKKDFLKQF